MKFLKKLFDAIVDITILYLVLTVMVWAVFLFAIAPKLNIVIWVGSASIWLVWSFTEYLKNKR